MVWRIPRVVDGILYARRPPGAPEIAVDSPAWAAWLEDRAARSFSFNGPTGTFTARKERRSGSNEEYWTAYRKRGGKLRKVYLGKAEKLTLGRLDDAAARLAGLGEKTPAGPSPDATAGDSGSGRADAAATEGRTTAGDPLLLTKLSVPSTRASFVPRPRLSELLREGLARKLTLVSAPAGFGKTVLLGAWISELSAGRPAAWLSLDPADNDPTRFWRYFITALNQLQPGSGETALALLDSPQAPPIETVLTTVLNEFAVLPADVVVVVDDYHLVESRAIHKRLAFLLEHLPPRMHLIIATRADPPLPLSRLRVRGELSELRAHDLSFTSEEAAAFLNEAMGLNLSAENIAELEGRTEGWIAGLQMAALAMRDRADVAGFIAAFAGSNRYVVDFLAEEVLGQQTEELRTFLLQTSILDRLCGPLCDAVTSVGGGQETLRYLEHANLFVVSLDEDRRWYRYHHLFADVLRQRLSQAHADQVPQLHRRASTWLERHGLVPDAVRHALEAHDFEQAAALLEKIGLSVMLPGDVHTLLGWLAALPDDLVRARPALCVVHGSALMFAARPEAAEARLDDAERGIEEYAPADQARTLLGQVATVRGNLARLSGNLARCVALSRRALELLSETEFMWTVAKLNAAYAYQVSGDVGPATERLAAEVIAPVRATQNPYTVLRSFVNLSRLQVMQGRLRQAAATFGEATRVAPGRGGNLVGNPAYYFGMGDLQREWNDLDAAERSLVQGMDLLSGMPTVDADVVALGYITLARVRQARGEYGAAIAALEEFSRLAHERNFFAPLVGLAAGAKAKIQLARGDLRAANRWADESGLHVDDEPDYRHEKGHLILARVLVARRRSEQTGHNLDGALDMLDRLSRAAESGERMGSVIEILILRALAHYARSETGEAFAALDRALTLAEPEGYVRVFVDEGRAMKALLMELLRARVRENGGTRLNTSIGYVRRLLTGFESPHASTGAPRLHVPGAGQPPSEPFTAREREVLRLIAEGFSNGEIAARLFIAPSTVKSYVNRIFRKLNVDSRTRAVVEAHRLHLLSD